MRKHPYEMVDVDTGAIHDARYMTTDGACNRNREFKANNEPMRWILCDREEEEETEQ